jgi:hypothetical protein
MLEPDEAKVSRPVLRGLAPSNGGWPLGIQAIDRKRTSTFLDLVAVGMPIARHPPHRPVLALLAHTVPTLDVWRRSAR